jgi:hypothetical protein
MYAYCTFNMFNEYLKLYIYNCFSFFFSNRKLAKFIVVLIPLFGVLYIVFSFLYNPTLNESKDIPILYCEMFYNSFQVTPNVYTCMCTRITYLCMCTRNIYICVQETFIHVCVHETFIHVCVHETLLYVYTKHYYMCTRNISICVHKILLYVYTKHYYICTRNIIICVHEICMCTRNMYVYMKHLYMYEYTKPLHRLVYYARM